MTSRDSEVRGIDVTKITNDAFEAGRQWERSRDSEVREAIRCAKCGSTNIYSQHTGHDDRMEHRCRNCRYSWWAAPLDTHSSEAAPTATGTGPWLVRLSCCGRDDGSQRCFNWQAASDFRDSYLAAADPGHQRSAIIAEYLSHPASEAAPVVGSRLDVGRLARAIIEEGSLSHELGADWNVIVESIAAAYGEAAPVVGLSSGPMAFDEGDTA